MNSTRIGSLVVVVLLGMVLLCGTVTAVTTWYVSPLGDDRDSGTSPSSAFETVAAAAAKANTNDTILLMNGAYTGDGNSNAEFASFVNIAAYDGRNQSTRVTCPSNSGWLSYGWTFMSGANVNALSFTGCKVAIYVSGGSSLSVSNCSFTAPSSTSQSPYFAVEINSPTTERVSVLNSVMKDAQVYWSTTNDRTLLTIADSIFDGLGRSYTQSLNLFNVAQAVVTNVEFRNSGQKGYSNNPIYFSSVPKVTFNHVSVYNFIGSAAVWVRDSSLTLSDCEFANNTAVSNFGPHLYSESLNPTIWNRLSITSSRFIGGNGAINGGAIALYQTKSVITDSSFENNVASGQGGVFWIDQLSSMNIFSSAFINNQASVGAVYGCTSQGMVFESDCVYDKNKEQTPSNCVDDSLVSTHTIPVNHQ